MKLTDFSYNLPEEKIAKYPAEKRGESNLMVIDRSKGKIQNKKYGDMIDYFDKGDVLVINTTKVEKVRVFFVNKRNDRKVESLFLNKIHRGNSNEIETWECLFDKAKKLQEGDILETNDGKYSITLEKKLTGGIFLTTTDLGISEKIFTEYGEVPLPPYMEREAEKEDYNRYNTIFANKSGSAAAPTASLNMTSELLENLKTKGVIIAEIQLNIGWGTFAPIRTEEIEDHQIHKESISVTKETAQIINEAKKAKKKIWALGTTVARTLESAIKENEETGEITSRYFIGNTDIYIHRGHKWNIVDHLITNFHMPQSSLLVMISAFMGRDLTMDAYEIALKSDYRFLSYGDTMLII